MLPCQPSIREKAFPNRGRRPVASSRHNGTGRRQPGRLGAEGAREMEDKRDLGAFPPKRIQCRRRATSEKFNISLPFSPFVLLQRSEGCISLNRTPKGSHLWHKGGIFITVNC
ncbi:hypothetical protein CDAR_570821 [Caerostris darwini]|uniref:Uncharacterized protein n=1 Tax=Caerostris darwini TaxID=1538125 RepID=A0AAV4QGL9_9ARAC|nr:hypothetical protein CDAR_570821 [Caerostris darwini]